MDVTLLPPTAVLVNTSERQKEDDHVVAERYAILQLDGQTYDAAEIAGTGRYEIRAARKLSVEIWTRCALDKVDDGTQILLNAIRGLMTLELQILNALVCFVPQGTDGNWFVTNPMQVESTTPPRRSVKDRTWITSTTIFKIDLQVLVDTSYNAATVPTE